MSICPQIWIVLFQMYMSLYICTPKTQGKGKNICLSIYLASELENSSLPEVNASPFLSDKHRQRGKGKELARRLFLWPSSHIQRSWSKQVVYGVYPWHWKLYAGHGETCLPIPASPTIQERRMKSITPQMFSMHLTCGLKEHQRGCETREWGKTQPSP